MFNPEEQRDPKGEHDGGEFASGGETAPADRVPQTVHDTVHAGTRGTRPADGKAAKPDKAAGKSFTDRLVYSMVMNADDVVIHSLKQAIQRNPQWFENLRKFAVAADTLAKSNETEARDPHGRWTGTGGGANGTVQAPRKRRKLSRRRKLIADYKQQLKDNADAPVAAVLEHLISHPPGWLKLHKAGFDPEQHPRDKDGRWTAADTAGAVVGLAGAGGAVGVGAAKLGLRSARRRAFAQAKASLAGMAPAREAVAARLGLRAARRAAAAKAIDRKLRRSGSTFLPTAIRGLSSQARREETALRDHMAAHSEPFVDVHSDTPEWASTDALGEAGHRERAGSLREQVKDLRENGRPTQVVNVAASSHTPKVETYSRTIRGPRKVIWRNPEQLAQIIAEDPEFYSFYEIHSLADAEAMVLRIPKRLHSTVLPDFQLPHPKAIIRPHIEQVVRNAGREIPAHTRRIEGYPPRAGRKTLSDQIRDDVATRVHTAAARDAVSPAATQPITAARVAARAGGGLAALRRLGALRQNGRSGILAAGLLGAAGAGAAAYAYLHRDQASRLTPQDKPLAKAAPTDKTPGKDQEQRTVFDAGAAVEAELANRLARTFGRWTQLPADQLAAGGPDLRDTLQADLQRATRPLDTAAEGGATADVGVQTVDRDGRSRIITLTLDAGSPAVKAFSDDYRVKLAGDMADEQLATVQAVLQDATLQGQAPAVTARILRQTIGLTPYQAGHVISFRRQLESLDPAVLDRNLRDKRFDRTVNRAILESNPLSDAQVDSMTEAYQRRYLAYRAETIARTEGLRAANAGHAAAIAGFTDQHPGFSVVKTWMATEDERTRHDHRALNGQQVVGMETPFVVPGNGDQIRWPHDPEAPLRQVVRCRCTFTTTLVPRTAVAQRGFALAADDPTDPILEDAI